MTLAVQCSANQVAGSVARSLAVLNPALILLFSRRGSPGGSNCKYTFPGFHECGEEM